MSINEKRQAKNLPEQINSQASLFIDIEFYSKLLKLN